MLQQIESLEELKKLLSSDSLIFKYSNACPISSNVMHKIEFLAADQDVYFLVVQDQRELSGFIEEKTGVKHETPQLLIIKNGKVVKHASHYKIDDLVKEIA